MRVPATSPTVSGEAHWPRGASGGRGQGSHVLSALATADALAVVPEGVEVHAAGGPVDLLWLDTE